MIKFFIIENHCKIPIKDSSTLIISDQFLSFVNKLFGEKEIEVIFFKAGILGNVMLNDGRFNEEHVQLDLERLNTEVGGKSIKAGSNLLLPEYKEDNICFVCFDKSITSGIHALFHELFHFEDLISRDILYSEETEKGTYIHTEKFIQNSVQVMLNEFYAEYRSFLIVVKIKVEHVMKDLNLNDLFETYIKLINDCYDNIKKRLSKIEFSDVFNFQIEMIGYSVYYFFKYFFGFLGMWRACKESGLDTEFLNTKWNEAVDLVKIFNDNSLGEVLNEMEEKISLIEGSDLFQNKEKILNSLTELFSEYYRNEFLNLIYI